VHIISGKDRLGQVRPVYSRLGKLGKEGQVRLY
jgi:hypothetical protein